MMILDGSRLIDITAEATCAQVPVIAHYLLAHQGIRGGRSVARRSVMNRVRRSPRT
jgi:hypothetical protein